MNRRLKYGIVAHVAIAAVGFVVFYYAMRGPTYEEFKSVQEGMSRDDVIAILGTPTMFEPGEDLTWLHFKSRDAHIVVAFEGERVVTSNWFETGNETEISRFRRWITGESGTTFTTGAKRLRIQ